MGNVDENAMRSHLEERLREGRTAYEAAGEVQFLNDTRANSETVSRETHAEMTKVVDEWLVERGTGGSDALLATAYTQFLAERVRFDLNSVPMAMIDNAWTEWRNRT